MFLGLIFMILLAVLADHDFDYTSDCDGYDEGYGTSVELSEDDMEYCDQVEKLSNLAVAQIVSYGYMVIISYTSCVFTAYHFDMHGSTWNFVCMEHSIFS